MMAWCERRSDDSWSISRSCGRESARVGRLDVPGEDTLVALTEPRAAATPAIVGGPSAGFSRTRALYSSKVSMTGVEARMAGRLRLTSGAFQLRELTVRANMRTSPTEQRPTKVFDQAA